MLYYLSLGANLGNREQTIKHALELIEQQVGHVLRCSTFYYSAPWGFQSNNEFCNICCCVQSSLDPETVLDNTAYIEQNLGRSQKSSNGIYHDRTIDIDIIRCFDQEKEISVNTSKLTIPHPLWKQRDFVRIPFEEIYFS